MTRVLLSGTVFLVLLVSVGPARGQCTAPSDCPPGSVCQAGTCRPLPDPIVEPPPAPPPAVGTQPPPAPPPAPVTQLPPAQPTPGMPALAPMAGAPERETLAFDSFYASLAGSVALYGWADNYEDEYGDVTRWTEPGGGLHLGVYIPFGPLFHLGAIFQWVRATHVKSGIYYGYSEQVNYVHPDLLTIGPSFKLGAMVSDSLWMGASTDVGVRIIVRSDVDNGYGVDVYPRFEAEWISRVGEGLKWGLYGGLGPRISPYYKIEGTGSWRVDIHLLFGVLLGA